MTRGAASRRGGSAAAPTPLATASTSSRVPTPPPRSPRGLSAPRVAGNSVLTKPLVSPQWTPQEEVGISDLGHGIVGPDLLRGPDPDPGSNSGRQHCFNCIEGL